VRKALIVISAALAVAACSNDNKSGPTKRVSADGNTFAIATDGAQHVAYLLGPTSGYAAPGDLHVVGTDGKDALVAMGVTVGAFLLSPDGKGMVVTQANTTGDDASLSWLDLSNPAAGLKSIFMGGLQKQPINPGSSSPTFPVPLASQGFLTPSGRYYVVGVQQPMVNQSVDLHVIDMDTGADVFSLDNGAFDYLELALPNDVMVFQNAVGGNGGIAGGGGLQTLFWVDLTSGSPTPTTIATRTGAYQPTGDNKTIVYQDADTRELYSWDAVARPATGTKIATGATTFAVGGTGPVAYLGTDRGTTHSGTSVHVVGTDGKAILDVSADVANADPFSPMYISEDGADVYYFQNVATQNAQGTLMHLSASAGATPAKIADSVSLSDVHPLAGGLLYLANVDGTGVSGDAFKSARDGSGAMALGTKVPVGFLTVTTPTGMAGAANWLSPHLINAAENKDQQLADAVRAIVGGLELTTSAGNTMIDPTVRIGQYQVSDDLQSLVYISGGAYDAMADNYVGSLEFVPVDMPTMKPAMPILTGVTELGSVVKRSLFVNAPKAPAPGVYLINF
jgi:hypothetical protein